MSAISSISPFAPNEQPSLPPLAGVTLGTTAAGIKYLGRDDVTVLRFDDGAQIAGVFTKSSTAGAPIIWCQKNLPQGEVSAIVINSGNANVFTGEAGWQFAHHTAQSAANLFSSSVETVFVSSTGVIGELPPIDRMLAGVKAAATNLIADNWSAAAKAIMTTDTFPKMATRSFEIDGQTVTLNGIAKGSGMIAPDMATMLVYLATDANVGAPALQSALTNAIETTFNAITVDSDTSTSDTVLLAATCKASHARIGNVDDPRFVAFQKHVHQLCLDLSHQVIKDGEGVSKFTAIYVTGATDANAAKSVAMSVANSPLVKTALAGSDPNWGRIMMAIGKSDVPIDQTKIALSIGEFEVAANGSCVPNYDETPVAEYMKQDEIDIRVDLGAGEGAFTVWTSDLTHGYIDINVDYRS